MMIKKRLSLLLLFISLNSFAQSGLFEEYSYIIIPTQFSIQETENEFQLNSLVRLLFKEDGFNVYMDKELLPDEVALNPCDGLRVALEKRFNIINTFITINIYDCQNNVVFSSEGSTKEKDFKTGYHDAIRDAFKEVERANFSLSSDSSKSIKKENVTLSKEERIEMRKQVVREQSDVYTFKGEELYFFPVDDEIHIYDSNAYDISAKLKPINETMYIYNSKELDGVMSKIENGNYKLEYREKKSKETKFLTFKLVKRVE
jgi:hypothetical protein